MLIYKNLKTFLIRARILSRNKFTTEEKYKNIENIFWVIPELKFWSFVSLVIKCNLKKFLSSSVRGISRILVFFYVIQFCRQQTPRGWYRIIWYLQNILLFTIGSLRTCKHILSTWPIRHARVLHVTWPTNQTIVILRSAHGAQPIRTRPHYAEEIWKRDIHLGQKRFSPPFRVRFKHIIIVTFSKCFSPH